MPILLHAIFSLEQDYHVLIIDDSSPDGTADIVKDLQQKYPRSIISGRKDRQAWLGTAYIHGFKWSIDKGYNFIFEMDADFSHRPSDLEKLYIMPANMMAQMWLWAAAMCTVEKLKTGPGTEDFIVKVVPFIQGLLPGCRLMILLPDLFAIKKKCLQTINLDEIKFVGYAFQIEMKFAAWKLGFKIKEVPITFVDRHYGTSKMSKGILKEGVLGVLKIQWHSLFNNYRRRVKNNEKITQTVTQ